MRTDSPLPIESRALGTLTYIKASIESAGSLAVPGMAGVVMGSIGLMAAALASVPVLAARWLEIWLIAASLAFLLGGALMAHRIAVQASARFFGPLKRFLLCLCPALLAGAVLTFILWRAGDSGLIPGTWLLLYGCAVVPASTATNTKDMKLIVVMGTLFVALGLLAFQAPPAAHTLILGTGFGALHVIFGLLIGRTRHGD